MAETSIEWADSVWNPVVGCTPVSAGCLNCYAATMARRLEGMGKEGYEPRHTSNAGSFAEIGAGALKTHRIAEVRSGRAVFTGDVRLLEHRLAEPLRWRKPRRIFVCSMADLFHEAVPFEFVDKVFAVAALCPQHQFLVLTKRPERMAEYLNENDGLSTPWRVNRAISEIIGGANQASADRFCRATRKGWWPLRNVWGGTSVENQPAADQRILHLLRCPLAVRFLSVEPLLGPVDLAKAMPRALYHCSECGVEKRRSYCAKCGTEDNTASNAIRGVDWVIVGGESGAKARPCATEWIRGVVRQCADATVPCFVKQVGSRPYTRCSCSAEDDGTPDPGCPRCGGDNAVEVDLRDSKGGDINEFPPDLRVRDWPTAKGGVQ